MAGVKNRPTATSALAAAGVLGVLLALVLTVLPAPAAVAATGINKTINFQGKVTNTNGTNVANGTYTFVFSIYTVASGGSNIWTETKSLSVTDGIFQTQLGDTTALPGSVDFNTDNIYLGMAFNSDPEMTPRIRFTASPYSFNSDLLDGLDSSAFAQLSPGSAQSGFLNVTGNVSSGATVAAATSVQAPLIDTASAVALNIGTGTATSVTIGRVTTPFLVQGNSTSTFTAKNGSFTTTVGFTTPTANNSISFPDAGGTICTTVAATCSATYQAAGSYVAKNAADTSSFAVTASNYLYGFTNSSSAVASGVLKLDNGTNTGNGLYVTATGNAGANSALIVADNTLNNSTGNLIDLRSTQSSTNASRFAVDTTGNVTQAGGSSTTQTINGQTISSAANFTGTVTAATSLLAPLLDTPSGTTTLNVGTTNATAGISLNQNVTVAANKTLSLSNGTAGSTVFQTQVTGDTNPRLTVAANGTLSWGGGSGAADATLSRNGASGLNLVANLQTTGLSVSNSVSLPANMKLFVQPNTGTTVGVTVRANASQSVNLAEYQDSSNNVNAAFSSLGNQLTLGRIASSGTVTQGALVFSDGTTDNFGATLNATTLTANRTITLPDSAGTICLSSGNCSAAGGYIVNGTGLQASSNFHISGNGTADTSITSPLFDAATAGTLSVGTSTATALTIGKTSVTTTIAGTTQVGASAGNGAFVNNGSTVNSTYAMANLASGGWDAGGASATVDKYTSISANQTTAGQTLTVPAPTANTVYGRLLYLSNIGTASFTLLGTTVSAGSTATLVWANKNGGAGWTFAGADGNGILNQNSADQTADFRISGTGRANTSFTAPLFDTITASQLNLGTGTANAISIGSSSVTTTVNGTLRVGASAGTGLLQNNGATVNTVYNMANLASGGWDAGGAAATVDIYTYIAANQTTASQTLTVPAPTASTTYGRVLYLSNIGTASFTLLGTTVSAGSTATLVWANKNGGAGWTFAGADGNGILNQNAADQTADFRISGTGRANTSLLTPLLDTATGVALALGTTNATAINLNQNTAIAAGKNLTMSSGAGQFSQTFTGTTTSASTITANSLTTGNALRVVSANNTAANTSWSAISFNPTNSQGTTAVSGANLISGLDIQFTQAPTVAGNNETVANFAIAANSGSPTDSTVNSIINVANNDTATGNQITATNGLLIQGSNIANGINLNGTFTSNLITATNFAVTQGGAITGASALLKPAADSFTTPTLQVQTSASNNIFTVASNSADVRVGIGLGGSNLPSVNAGLEILGALRLTGGGGGNADTYTTPVGASVATKINIPFYDAGNFGQILSMGLPATNCTGANTGSCTARVMSLFDARTLAHQPTISVFNPGESDVLGFSWDGSATVGLVKNTASTIGLMANNLSVAQFANSSGNAVITTGTNATLTASASNKLDITANAASTWSTSAGNLTVDSAASLNLGTSAATGVSIGKNGTTTTSAGNVTVGTAGSTTLFKNNGATQNVVCAYTGVTGATTLNTAGKTVDGCTSFTIVTTGAATLTVPAPAAGAGSIVYISVLSTSTNAPTLLGVSLGIGSTATLVYNGSAWTYAGADANSLQTAYNNSTDPEIVLGTASTAGLSVRDNASAISGNLFEVTNNGGTTSYLSVTSAAANVGGNLTFTKEAAHTIQITDSTTAAAAGGALTVKAAAGNTSGAGGALALAGGAGGNAGAGGAASLTGGASGGGATAGGAVTIQGGASNATAGSAGGGVSIQGAAGSTTGTGAVGGTIALQAGNSGGTGNNTGGAITLQGGTASSNASAVGGAITLTAGAGSTTAGSTGGTTTINGGAAGAVAGGLAGGVAINGGAGSSTGTGSAGAPVNIKGGNAGGSGANNGGAVTFTGGNAAGAGTGGAVTIQGGAAAAVAGSVGGGVAIQGANGSSTGTGAAGGSITLTAGNGQGSGNNNGGSIQFTAGTATGTGVPGVISIDTPVFTATTETASGASYALTQSNVDGYSTIVVTENTANAIVTVPAPRNTTTGRILYITAAGSNSFTLTPSGGPSVNMSPGNTTMLVWNNAVSQWTASASGGSLQQAYNNTSGSPASIVTTSSTKNILLQAGNGYDNANLFQIGNGLGAQILTVDTTNTASTSTNLGNNTGAESGTTGWTAYTGSGTPTISQDTGAGNFASGTAAIKVNFASSVTGGVQNDLSAAALATTATTYNVSFSVKFASSAPSLANFIVEYYRNSTPTLDATCSTPSAAAVTLSTSAFVKYTCTFTSTGNAKATTNFIRIRQADSATRAWYIDNFALIAQNTTATQNTSDLQVGGPNGQGLTLLTLDSYAGTPWTGSGTSLLGSMYYDTTVGLIKCYQASGWGTCGAAPNNNVIMVPEYGSAVLNAGTGGDTHIGTMTANMCSGSSRLSLQPTEGTICAATEEYNYYRWTSGQTSAQTYSIFAKYQLPPTFNNFYDNNTINVVGRVSSTTDASVSYSLYGNTGTQCGSTTNVASAGANTWYTTALTGNETSCGMQPSDIITFKIDMSSKNNAYAYVSNVMFTMTGK